MAPILVLVAGCQTVFGLDRPEHEPIDAPPADAAPTGPHYHYVVDHEIVPTTNGTARMNGLDLDGDTTVDNGFGMVLSTLFGQGLDIATPTTTDVDRGVIITLIDLQTADFGNATASGVQVFRGANPSPAACTGSSDLICRHHLDGTGSFTLPSPVVDPQLVGPFVDGVFAGGPGRLSIQLSFGSAGSIVFPLIGARVRLANASAVGIGDGTLAASGILAGGISERELHDSTIPQLAAIYAMIISRDCTMSNMPPGCGCMTNSEGKTLLGLFDTGTKDCAVTAAEIEGNSLIVSLLAPDITLDGEPALSIGIGFTAVKATFAVP